MPNLSSPFVDLTNSFSGIFGSEAYSGVNQLLGVQMKMLDNISAQLDNVQKAVISILENQAELEKKIDAIPSKTIEQLYKSDLNGLFIILREKFEAYIAEKNNNTLNPQKIELIFDEILRELQLSRWKIMSENADIYLNLPVIVTCLHFEIFCMVISRQPLSYIRIVLNSYKNSIEKILSSKLQKDFETSHAQQKNNLDSVKGLFVYSKTKETFTNNETDMTLVLNGGEPIVYNRLYSRIYITKYDYTIKPSLSDIEKDQLQPLLESGILQWADSPIELVVDMESKGDFIRLTPIDPPGVTMQQIAPLKNCLVRAVGPSDTKPNKIAEGFIINESDRELVANAVEKPQLATNPLIDEATRLKISNINDNAYKLIIYASLNFMAKEALDAIEKLSATPGDIDMDYLLDFATKQENIVRISNDRMNIWVKYVDDNIALVQDEAKKAQILEIRNQMQALKESGKGILQEYAELEKKLAEEMPKDLLGGVLKLLAPIGRELEKGVQNIIRESDRFVGDLGRNLEKAAQDLDKNGKKAFQDVGDLVVAVEGFIENEIRAYGKNLTEAEKRVREWKMVDALWGIGTDSFNSTQDSAAKAFQDSSLLTSIATSAASIYGAPYGGAAFAAWLTYKQTGSLDAALKTAVITYLTQEANASAKSIDTVEITGLVKKTLVTSAIGAAAIAASGWGEKQIIDGFLKGASLSLANEAYKNTTKLDIEGKPPKYLTPYNKDGIVAEETFYDKTEFTFLDKEGNHVLDITKLSRDVTHLGIASMVKWIATENSYPMQLLAQIPFMNDMAYYHDQLCAIYKIEGLDVQATIIPATILTYAGSERPLMDQIIQVIKENQQKK